MYHNINRLANILLHTSEDNVWNIVKQVAAQKHNDEILTKVTAVEEKVKIETSEFVFENMPRQHLKTASEMFLYLKVKFEPVTKMWLEFFGNLFENESADQIVLTLSRIMRKTKGNNIYLVSEMLFRKATNLFQLKYQEIQSLMPGKIKNISDTGSKSSIINGMNR